MQSAELKTDTLTTTRRLARFVGHYLEMVVAMVVGMIVLAPVWPDAWTARGDVGAVAMALDMIVAMVVWMTIRRHSWPRIAEMSAAMLLPFPVLLVPYWLGALSATGLMVAAHVIMFPLMLAAMLWRRGEYGL